MLILRAVLLFLGAVILLALAVPTVAANHLGMMAPEHTWNDTGINTILIGPGALNWNDAGVRVAPPQIVSLSFNDAGLNSRLVRPVSLAFNDTGLNTRLP